jgi:hypothetical protein
MVKTGEVLGRYQRSHRSVEFRTSLNHIDAMCLRRWTAHLIKPAINPGIFRAILSELLTQEVSRRCPFGANAPPRSVALGNCGAHTFDVDLVKIQKRAPPKTAANQAYCARRSWEQGAPTSIPLYHSSAVQYRFFVGCDHLVSKRERCRVW